MLMKIKGLQRERKNGFSRSTTDKNRETMNNADPTLMGARARARDMLTHTRTPAGAAGEGEAMLVEVEGPGVGAPSAESVLLVLVVCCLASRGDDVPESLSVPALHTLNTSSGPPTICAAAKSSPKAMCGGTPTPKGRGMLRRSVLSSSISAGSPARGCHSCAMMMVIVCELLTMILACGTGGVVGYRLWMAIPRYQAVYERVKVGAFASSLSLPSAVSCLIHQPGTPHISRRCSHERHPTTIGRSEKLATGTVVNKSLAYLSLVRGSESAEVWSEGDMSVMFAAHMLLLQMFATKT